MDVSLVLAIAVVIGLFLLLFAIRLWLKRGPLFSDEELRYVRERFADLDKRVYWDPKHAVLEGDKLLDLLLQRKGYRGSLGEKLKKAHKKFSNIQDLWDAHKIRNRVAHELKVRVEPRDAKRAVASYKGAYRQNNIVID